MLTLITKYSKVAWGLLVSLGIFLLMLFARLSGSNTIKRKVAEAKAEKAEEVAKADEEIIQDFDRRTLEMAREIEENGTTDELSKPNDW